MEKDLTTGNIFQRILIFAFPIFIGNVFQQLYNMADSIIVGRFVGKDAFAAVGSTGSLNFLIIGFVLGLSSGLHNAMVQINYRTCAERSLPQCKFLSCSALG